MIAYLRGIYYSLPLQLVFLHFRKYQVLLIFWFVLFSSVNGGFMKTFGFKVKQLVFLTCTR